MSWVGSVILSLAILCGPLTASIDTDGYTYQRGTAVEKVFDPEQVTIGTWNICGTHLSQIYGGVIDWKYRFPGLLQTIREADPDVMVLQEVYDPEISDLLVQGLQDRYAHLFTHLGPNPNGHEGGCMILSKYPASFFSNTSFTNNKPTLNRSFGTLELKKHADDPLPSLRIVGAHVMYGYTAEDIQKREAQVEQIRNYAASRDNCPTIIAADFNIERGDPILSFLEHGYKGEECTSMTTALIRQWNPTAEGPLEEWIDNISLIKGSPGIVEASMIRGFDPVSLDGNTALSDHHLLLGTYKNRLPYAQKELIFQTPDAVEKATREALNALETNLTRFVEQSNQKKTDEAYHLWSNLQFRFFSFLLELDRTHALTQSDEVKQSAAEQKELFKERAQALFHTHPDLASAFRRNAANITQLTPQQRRFTASILNELNLPRSKPLFSQASFATAKGLAAPQGPTSVSELKVFTANILAFPGKLPYLFGGALPWQERIDALSEKIIASGAHIVCLQEAWDPEVMLALNERLKDDYAYFVYNAGDPAGTLSIDRMGYSSGLWIASKLPLQEIEFQRFTRSTPIGSNRGALLVTVQAKNATYTILNTHLQHGASKEEVSLRKEQLQHCSKALLAKPNSRGILTGDLNIDAFLPEFKESGLTDLFLVPESSQATCTGYLSDLVHTAPDQRGSVPVSYELLDYCISPTDLPRSQQRISLIDLDRPAQSLSDHDALLTTW